MRRSDWLVLIGGVVELIVAGVIGFALAMLLVSCTGYFAPGGASLYCKDRDGKAIHCPETRDSTKADTTHTVRQ